MRSNHLINELNMGAIIERDGELPNIDKLLFVILLSSFSMGILSLRMQSAPLFLVSIAILFISFLYTRNIISVILLSVLFGFLYPGASFGYIFDGDAQSAAFLANEIHKSGWPIDGVIYAGGFPETPFIHIHVVVLHQITEIAMFPSPLINSSFVQSILPLIYILSIISIAYCFAKRISWNLSPETLLMAVCLWTPLYHWVAFRRQTAGYVLFTLCIFLIYLLFESSFTRGQKNTLWLATIITVFSLAISHHLSFFIYLLFFSALLVGYQTSSKSEGGRSPFLKLHLFLLSLVIMSVWYLWTTNAFGFIGLKLVEGLGIISQYLNEPQLVKKQVGTISSPLHIKIRTFYSKWIYQLILAIGVAALVLCRNICTIGKSRFDKIYRALFIFGIIIAILSWIGNFSLMFPIYRQMIFFVISGGIISLEGYNIINNHTRLPVTNIVLSVLFIISLIMIPPYYITDSTTIHTSETSERFDEQIYMTSEWVKKYDTSQVVSGDRVIYEVTTPIIQNKVNDNAEKVLNGRVPSGTLILRDKNKEVYRGQLPKVESELSAIPAKNLFEHAERRKNKIYSTNNTYVFK